MIQPGIRRVRPRFVYFDVANYEDLVPGGKFTHLRSAFDAGVERGDFWPVLSFIHVLEFAKKSDELRANIIDLLGPHAAANRVLWVRSERVLVALETEFAIQNAGRGRLPLGVWFRRRWQDIVERDPNSRDWAQRDTRTFGEFVEAVRATDLTEYVRRAEQLPQAMRALRKRARSYARASPGYDRVQRRAVSLQYVSDRIYGLPEFDPELMPALKSLIDYESGLIASSGEFRHTDTEDRLHMPGLVYADCGFVDRLTYKRMRLGGADPSVLRLNADFERELPLFRPVSVN